MDKPLKAIVNGRQAKIQFTRKRHQLSCDIIPWKGRSYSGRFDVRDENQIDTDYLKSLAHAVARAAGVQLVVLE